MINAAFLCVFVLMQLYDYDAHSLMPFSYSCASILCMFCALHGTLLLVKLSPALDVLRCAAHQHAPVRLCCGCGVTLYPCPAGGCCSPTLPSG